MKKIILTAAVVILAVSAQAQDRANKQKMNESGKNAAVTQPSAAEAKQENNAGGAAGVKLKSADGKTQQSAQESRSQRGVQEQTVMPDGTSAPASAGEKQHQPAPRAKSANEAAGTAGENNNSAGQRAAEPAKPANVDDGKSVAPAAPKARSARNSNTSAAPKAADKTKKGTGSK